jgi:hypothetical protein
MKPASAPSTGKIVPGALLPFLPPRHHGSFGANCGSPEIHMTMFGRIPVVETQRGALGSSLRKWSGEEEDGMPYVSIKV